MSKKYRVGIDLAPASLTKRAPGTARLVYQQSLALFALDVPWTWVPLVESTENPLYETVAPFDPIIVPGTKLSLRATFDVGKAWQRAQCDLGFCTAYFVPLTGPPVIANFYDTSIYDFGNTWVSSGNFANFVLIRMLSYLAAKRARKLLINSHYSAGKLALVFPETKAKIVANQCGLSPKYSGEPQTPAWAASLKKPFCLYVGVFSDNKNQYRLIEAWSQLQAEDENWPVLVLVGPCSESYHQLRIEPALRSVPRPHEIVLAGAVPDAELAWCYANAAQYIQPSIAEGFNLCVMEAMQYSIPVACANTTSHPEAVGDAGLFFNPFDVDDMKGVIRQLWQNVPLRDALVQKGLKHSAQFTWENNAKRVVQAIDEVLHSL